jgi:hypothetical protein
MSDLEKHKEDEQLDVAHEEGNNDEVRRYGQDERSCRWSFKPSNEEEQSDFAIGGNPGNEAKSQRDGR